MARTPRLNVVVDAKTDGLERGYDRATKKTKGFVQETNTLGNTLKGKLGAALAGVAVGAFVTKLAAAAAETVRFASDLDEASNKVKVVFGAQGQSMVDKWADNTVTAMGLSSGAALEAAGTFGNLLTSFGAGQSEAADMSKGLTQLAADLASFNNTSVDDALTALRSGLSGEMEPLKRFGVTLSDVRLRAEAAALGIETTSAALDPLTKSMAAYSLIMKDTTNAQGDFARTSDGLANTQRILQAAVEDAKAEIGQGLVRAIERFADAAGGPEGAAEIIDHMAKRLGMFIDGVAIAATGMGDFNVEIEKTNRVLKVATDNYDRAGGGVFGFADAVVSANMAGENQIQALITGFSAISESDRRTRDNAEAQSILEAGYRRNASAARDMAKANLEVASSATRAAAAITYTQYDAYGVGDDGKTFAQRKAWERLVAEADAAAAAVTRGAASSTAAVKDNTKAVEAFNKAYEKYADGWREKSRERVAALETETRKWTDLQSAVSGAFGSSLGSAISAYNEHVKRATELDKAMAEAITKGDKEGQAKAAAERAALGQAEDYVTAWVAKLEYGTAVKAKIGAAMAALLADNPQLKDGAKLLTDQLLTLDPAEADAAISKLVNTDTLPKIAGALQANAATDNVVSTQFADLFYGAGVAAAASSVEALEAELAADKSVKRLRAMGKKAGKTVGGALAKEIGDAVNAALAAAAAATAGARLTVGGGGAARSVGTTTQPVSITVNAGVGDPVSIARSVEAVLNKRASRLGI